MRLFRKKAGKVVFQLQGETAAATKAVYQGVRQLPTILLTFKTRGTDPVTGEHFDQIEIELDVYEASKFANMLLVSLSAALPDKPRGPMRVPFE